MREGVVLWIQDGDLREGEDIVGKRGSVMGGGGEMEGDGVTRELHQI